MRARSGLGCAWIMGALALGCGGSDTGTRGDNIGTAGFSGLTAGSGGVAGVSAGTFGTAGDFGGPTAGTGFPTAGTGSAVAGSGALAGSGGTGGDVAGTDGGGAGFLGPAGTGGDVAGTGAAGTGEAGTGAAGTGSVSSSMPKLPTATGTCPTFSNGKTVQVARAGGKGNMNVIVYIDPAAKSKPAPGGPLILYYHATGGQPSEVNNGFGQANISKVTSMGGVVASFTTTACSGCATTDDAVWFEEDNAVQDQVVACAIQQANIDVTRIHALGWSAGALHSTYVGLSRSNYMASIISYSGGLPPWPGTSTPQDPTNHLSAVMTYGDTSDAVVINFNTQSKSYYSMFQPMGYYTMMCNHPGGHEIDPMVAPHSLEFFLAHPFKVNPAPWASAIPAGWPSYCKNAP